MAEPDDPTRIGRERDLYRRLLELGGQTALEPFLRDALALIVEVVGVRQGYLELHGDEDAARDPRWWMAHGFDQDEIRCVRAMISSGIMARAVATGQTVITESAMLDPRFSANESVHAGRIQEVLCAPIGADVPQGVLYLQGRKKPGAFSAEDCEDAEIFTRHLAPFVDRLVAQQRRQDVDDPTRALRGTLRLDAVIGRSRALATMLRQVALVAPLEVNVLITGESGTGKSHLARVVHDNGPRASGPFVELNCAALPEALVESELFGAFPGAHSTATRRVEGKVTTAERGTLLLDEVGELPLNAQAKLLQLLQSRQYYPLGASKPLHADVRVIAAGSIDLRRAVAERRFREDLYYRLHVVPIRMPSLGERREDVPELAAFFCAGAVRRHGLAEVTLSPGALRAAETADWPGNVRELASAVEAAVIRAAGEGARQVEKIHLFPEIGAAPAVADEAVTFQQATRRFQADLLRETLEQNGWNVLDAARRLDLSRAHVYSLIRAFGLERDRR